MYLSPTEFHNLVNSVTPHKSNGIITIPKGYSGITNFITEDDVVELVAKHFNLASTEIKTLDPMCGLGTVPRIINSLGGYCNGVEIDDQRCKFASACNPPGAIIQGDFREVISNNEKFDAIYIGMPFSWVKPANRPDKSYAEKVLKIMRPSATMIVETLLTIARDGEEWEVALPYYQYFCENGFQFQELIRIQAQNEEIGNYEIIELIFKPKPVASSLP